MKKSIFTLFMIIMFVFTICIKVSAYDETRYHFDGLQIEEKPYYLALQKMYLYDYFEEGKSLNLVEKEYINNDIFRQYTQSNFKMFDDFKKAKSAFLLDYPEAFYLDEDKLSLDIYVDQNGKNICEISSGRFENYLLDGYTFKNLKEQIQEKNDKISLILKEVKKIEKVQDRINYFSNDNTLTPQEIKMCLDQLNINNYIFGYTGSLDDVNVSIDGLYNAYEKDQKYYELKTKVLVEEFGKEDITISKPYVNFEDLKNREVQLLENYKETNLLVLSDIQVEEATDVLFSELIDIVFLKNNAITLEEFDSQTVLIPYPAGYSFGSYNVKYSVEKFNLLTNEFETIKSTQLPMGIVVELDNHATLRLQLIIEEEESKAKDLVILTTNGGSVNIGSVNSVLEDKNLKFVATADKGWLIERVLVDGVELSFKDNEKLEFVFNYEEINQGSLVQISFIEENRYNSENQKIQCAQLTNEIKIIGDQYALVGESKTLTAEYVGNGRVSYEWYKNGEIVGYTQTNTFTISEMKEENRGEYTVKVIDVVGNKAYTYESEPFMLYDSVTPEDNPIYFAIIFAVLIFIIFVMYLIIDNLSIKHHRKIQD